MSPAGWRSLARVAGAGVVGLLATGVALRLVGAGGALGGAPGVGAAALLAAVCCIARAGAFAAERRPWLVMAYGLAMYGIGFFVPSGTARFPSPADLLWLQLYPAAGVALTVLSRRRLLARTPWMWLDGLVGALAVCALGGTLLVQWVGGDVWSAAGHSAYLFGDLVLLGAIIGVASLSGWRISRTVGLILLAILTLLVGDTEYFRRVLDGTWAYGTWLDLTWLLALGLTALAAWQPPVSLPPPSPTSRRSWLVPAGLTLAAVAAETIDHFHRLPTVTIVLVGLILLLAPARLALAVAELRRLASARRLALTDELTGLPNRRALVARLEASCRDAVPRALVLLDLDSFKELNDTFGHASGDELLRRVGSRLADGGGEESFVARLGGDEFAALVPAAEAMEVADRLRAALAEPLDLEGLVLRVEASAGIARASEHGAGARELLAHADAAMYAAKAARTGVEEYVPAEGGADRDRLVLAAELPRALAEGELVLYFQPQARLGDSAITGAEALVRWRHPERGLLLPAQFLSLVEQSSLVRPFTVHVLDLALGAARRWRDAGEELRVAVNLSAANLADTELASEVERGLARHRLAPATVILEVTETALSADPTRSTRAVDALVDLGVEVSVDDFGTGWSSLDRLRRTRASELKVDRAFVSGLGTSDADAAIVRATVSLGRDLGLRTVAEGVEDEDTLRELRGLGCDLAQGFHLSPPLPEEELLGWLAGWRARVEAALVAGR